MLLRLLPLVLFLTLVGFLGWGLRHDPHQLPSTLIGKAVPAFQADSLMQPGPIDQTVFKGKITLLNVWASWCTACQAEHAFLWQLAQSGKVQLVGLNYKDDALIAKQWLLQMNNPYQAVIIDATGQLASQLGVYGTPETFLIDRAGIIRYRLTGPLTQKIWQRVLQPKIATLTQYETKRIE